MTLVFNALLSILQAKQDDVLQAVILCAPEDEELASRIAHALDELAVRAVYGQNVIPSWYQAKVLIPVLTSQFLWGTCTKAMLWAHQRDLGIVPVLADATNYCNVTRDCTDEMVAAHPSLKEELPFLCSVLNRCNRIPRNAGSSHCNSLARSAHA